MENKKMTKIAHLTPAFFSAGSEGSEEERYISNLVKSLSLQDEFDQHIFTIGQQQKTLDFTGTPVHVLRNESRLPGKMDVFSSALWRELSEYDLVHVHQFLTLFGVYSISIVKSMNIPLVGTDLSDASNTLMLNRRGINLLDGVVSVSQFAHDLLRNYYYGPHLVLNAPVDPGVFTPAGADPRDPKAVVCTSPLLPEKGIDQVIAAMPGGLRLIVIGRRENDAYFELLQKMADGKNIQFILDADDAERSRWYRSAGLFVQASPARDIYGNPAPKPELMGLIPLEAMSCGLPAVVADAGSLPELVTDPRFGRVFGDTPELAAIFREFAEGVWPAADAGGMAAEYVRKEHSLEAIGGQLADFYRAILEKRIHK